MSDFKKDYKKKVKSALDNEFLRKSMDNFAVAYRDGQTRAYKGIDKDALVKEIVCLKDAAAANLDALYVQFKKKAEEKGIKVYLADTAEDANRIIADIARSSSSKTIVKSKSMTSEETHLNRHLEAENLKVTETDLGEWIIQLRKEGPSHMVMPAIHLSRYQVSDLFSDVTRTNQDPENIDNLVKVARFQLRSKFSEADMGITGANFLLADTATVGIVTNEGNARLTSTLPKTHVVLTGVDKLLPGLPEALTVLKALPRNATGQAITSYVTWITGQNECVKNEDNRKDIHIVLLDNGRKALAKDKVFNEVLRCIRCGACANVCPVYRMVGGHTMGHVYIGAIGLILTYFYHGKEEAEKLIGNCIGCGACKNICAGGMNLPDVIKSVAA
jgi:iron-sulfur cluster protein